ncbi:MAG: translocation/assembly module TamB [Bacteroidaceae bacterium]|nr:translocation/assembly module TamB [Bacteroidaceae bacterium]
MLLAALGLFLFTALPASQRWLAAEASAMLSEDLGTRVTIGRARIGLLNRVVLDDVLLLDQQSDTLLAATRLSVKISLKELASNRIYLSSAQLYGYQIHLRRPSLQEPYNFQFLLDHFASDDTTSSPLNLALSQVVVRRGRLTHDITSEPASPTFSPAHFALEDLRLNLSADTITNESTTLKISELSFSDSNSGLTISDLSLHLSAYYPEEGDIRFRLEDFQLQLPSSDLQVPQLSGVLHKTIAYDSAYWQPTLFEGSLRGHLVPADLSALLPQLSSFREPVRLHANSSVVRHRLRLSDIQLQLSDDLSLDADLSLGFAPSDQSASLLMASLRELHISPELSSTVLDLLAETFQLSPTLVASLQRLGDLRLQGNGRYGRDLRSTELQLSTSVGSALLQGDITSSGAFQAHVETDKLRPTLLAEDPADLPLDDVSLAADVSGNAHAGTIKGNIQSSLLLKSEPIDRLQADFDLAANDAKGVVTLYGSHYRGQLQANVHSPRPLRFDTSIIDELSGNLQLSDVAIHTEQSDYDLQRLEVKMTADETRRHSLSVQGDFINAACAGDYSYLTLVSSMQQAIHQILPSLIPLPSSAPASSADQLTFELKLHDSDALSRLLGLSLSLPEPGYIQGSFSGATKQLSTRLDAPHVVLNGQDLRALSLIAQTRADSLDLFLSAQRMIESGPLDVSLLAHSADDLLHSTLSWDDHNSPAQRGEVTTATHFSRSETDDLVVDLAIQPTQIIVADTAWNVHPATLRLADGVVHVNDFEVSLRDRHLRVDGRASSNPADTLFADLRNVNLQYVFGIIDFHDVEFAGHATGKVKVANFSGVPWVSGLLNIEDFQVNDGFLGRLAVDIGFGRKDDRAIDLDGLIYDPSYGTWNHVVGIIKPGREAGRGMDLHINADHLNTYFINSFTEDIFDDVQARASGYAHIHGPFKELNLEGEVVLDSVALGLPYLGTRYHTHGGDTLHLHPGGIRLGDIHLYDHRHGTDLREHHGVLRGELRYRHFKNLYYDFTIQADDLLGYDFREFGDQTFCGTAFADGTVHLLGKPGELRVDIAGTPAPGTVFTYNASTPETTTDNAFITFNSRNKPQPAPVSDAAPAATAPDEVPDDGTNMYINFDLNINPQAQMRLLMDPRSGDYINLYGDGHIRATYYNKGRFQMYGTFRVDHGNYRLSLQEFIRKEFQFQQGGTIVFGGSPMKGDLNLQAVYTVPSVSLNDLATGSNFSASSVRVNCLMNIGGQAENPQISFDFDIPNVNEDEKQMVRSLISTDEERNLQVIYLLGIGRFYTYGLDANQGQTNTAMQGLLSSTLSGQLNNVLSNAIGSNNWNFGTNLSTGTLGWQDMDVEGSLSGRLLNNRLLINGTFGYHDTPIANTNFIGDFDVRYLLTKSGTVSLKAYSETNDRYFTKSALTTQGIGFQLSKNFSSFRDLFRTQTSSAARKKREKNTNL